ncbi:hypothetical protein [Lacinutrix undariae]
MKYCLLILITLTIISCQSHDNSEKKSGTEKKIFGDSLKVIYEYKGDTVFQKRIDLKGTSDDNFDSSFDVMSIWSTKRTSDLDCPQILELKKDSIRFRFCIDDVLKKVENDIEAFSDKPWKTKGLQKLKEELLEIKTSEKSNFSKNMFNLSFHWLKEIKFYGFDDNTDSEIIKVLVEKYETNFSGGTNYHLVNEKNDTIADFHFNQWMR